MKFKQINEKFTTKVAEYISNGYTINASSMCGSQGEIAKIDLTDGTEIIRIMVDRFSETESKTFKMFEGVRIVVGKNTDDTQPHSSEDYRTVWNNNLDVIEEEKFYLIGRRGENEYYGTYEQANEARDKNMERYMQNGSSFFGAKEEEITSDRTVSIVIPYIQNHRHIQRVARDAVRIVRVIREDGNVHKVYYHDECYMLR